MPSRPPCEKGADAVGVVWGRLRRRLNDRFSVRRILVAAAEEFPAEPYYRGIAIGIAVSMWEEQERQERL